MSSIQGEEKCPRCGGIMLTNFDCNTAEENRICTRCGFEQNWFLLRNEDGAVQVKEDGTWLGDYKETIHYGAAEILDEDGRGIFRVFTEPLSDEKKAEYIKLFQEEGFHGYVIAYDPNSGVLTPVVGELPEDFITDRNETEQEENS